MSTAESASALALGVARQVAAAGVPGCAMALWHQGRTARAAFGFADLRQRTPMRAESVLHLFSGTKLYTAAALMKLVEAGTLRLDAPVSEYLPSLALRHPVTLRQLASHASGLPDTLRALAAVHLAGDPAPTAAEALARYAVARGGQPGVTVAYRNVNYAILGAVISTVTGVPFDAFVAREILSPLGSQATFEYTADQLSHAAVGYIPRFSPMRLLLPVLLPAVASRIEDGRDGRLVRLRPFSLDTAAIGGLIGRAEDFLPLAVECLTAGDGLLTAGSKREMLTPHARGAAGITSTVGVGIGWKLGEVEGTRFWNHEGGGAGFTSETRIYPDAGLGIVLLMNATQTPALSTAAHRICEAIRQATDRAA